MLPIHIRASNPYWTLGRFHTDTEDILDSVVTRYGATRRDNESAQQQGMTKAVSYNA